jgi:translation initiation factor IF-3
MFQAAPSRAAFSVSIRRSEIAELRVNGYIRAQEVRVVAPDGSQIGVKKLSEALWLADQLGLDLVEVAPNAKPPVCRLMDYGKWKYEQSVRDREARKKQTKTVIKEARLTPRIAEHDFQMQARRTVEWLSDGDKVKVTVRFRGRERERPEFGQRVLDRLVDQVGDWGVIEQSASFEGRNLIMTLAPNKRRPKDVQDADGSGDDMELDDTEFDDADAPETEPEVTEANDVDGDDAPTAETDSETASSESATEEE